MADARLQRTREAYQRRAFERTLTPEERDRLQEAWIELDTGPRLTLGSSCTPPVAWQVRWYTIRLRRRLTWSEWWQDLRYLLWG